MNRQRTIIGSFLATFLLVSIAFITPVQADATKISKDMDKLSKDLSGDSDFLSLLEDADVQELADLVYEENRDNGFENQVKQLFNTIREKQEFKNLVSKYGEDIEELIDKIPKKEFDKSKELPSNVYYKISDEGEGIKLSKQTTFDPDNNGIIIRSSDCAMHISGYGWLNGGILQSIVNFLKVTYNIIAWAGIVTLFISMILMSASLILRELPSDLTYELSNILWTLSAVMSSIGQVLAYSIVPIWIVITILEFILKITNKTAKDKQVNPKPIVRMRERVNLFFQKIISRYQNLFCNLQRIIAA